MMRSKRAAALLAASLSIIASLSATLCLSGCGRFGDYAKVLEGNRLHERGDYQGAIVAYLGASRRGASSGVLGSSGGGFAATVDYDTANVYARLGEYSAAAELYAAARRERGREGPGGIAADSFFNEGVALFERGRYRDSWKAFRDALGRMDPASAAAADARRNLELAWRAWKKSSLSPPRSLAASSRGSPAGDESEQRLLQRLETGRWRPGTGTPAAPSSLDY
jgi:tetratricopeptide (TPR) repeat protein